MQHFSTQSPEDCAARLDNAMAVAASVAAASVPDVPGVPALSPHPVFLFSELHRDRDH